MKWLCVAHEKEIPGLTEAVPAGFALQVVGVGQFDSLFNFGRLTAAEKPEAVLLAGSCGTSAGGDIMRTYACHHFAFPLVSGEELPEFLHSAFQTRPALAMNRFAAATVLQNHGVSVSAEKFTANAAAVPADFPRPIVENMEAASLALACRRLDIPFTALLCVTNSIGPEARVQWKQNFRTAGTELARVLQSL